MTIADNVVKIQRGASPEPTFLFSLMARSVVLLGNHFLPMSKAEKPTGACTWCMVAIFTTVSVEGVSPSLRPSDR